MHHRVIQPSSTAQVLFRALTSSFKRPGRVSALPALTLEMPEVVIRAEHLAAYAQVCGFVVQNQVPLTYPQVLTFPLVMDFVTTDCPWPAMGTVHLSNAITQHQPLRVGEVCRVKLVTGDLLAHDKGQVFTLDLSVWRESDGVCVWQARQTLLRLGVLPASGSPWQPEVVRDAPLQVCAEFDAPADIGRRYGRVSGDHNPIHWSAISARCLGFRRAIAHGLWTQARALAVLHPEGLPQAALLHTDFKRPLWLPACVKVAQSPVRDDQTLFEVRDASSDVVHLRAELTIGSFVQGKLS